MPIVLQGASGAAVELLTYGEAAAWLDIAAPTVQTYVHRGVLHSVRPARSVAYPAGTPFVLREELAWYDRRRRSPNVAAAGPSPYAELYADLLAAGALAETAGPVEAVAASVRAAPTPTPASVEASLAWGAILALLAIVLLALFTGRRPDAGKLEQLRGMPGAGRLPETLRAAAELLDTRAAA